MRTDASTTNEAAARSTTLVTVTYGNRLEYLKELLRRAFRNEHVGRAIVVSNASSSNLELLEQEWENKLRIIRLPHNTGSAYGYATGIEAALGDGASYLWLMDDDNAPIPGALRALHEQLTSKTALRGADKAAVLGFRPDHQPDVAEGYQVKHAYPPPSSFLGFHFCQLPFKVWRRLKGRVASAPTNMSVPYAPYGGLLAKRDLFQSLGLPIKDFVLYADDTEYTHRITSAGGSIDLVVNARLEDLEGSWNRKAGFSSSFRGWLKGGTDFRAYYAARNRVWFDRHAYMGSKATYLINKYIYLSALNVLSVGTGSRARYQLVMEAVRDGEMGKLGQNPRFPLS